MHDAFNVKVDATNAQMAWGAPHVTSWYKNKKGRVSQNWPFPLVDYWTATLRPNPADFCWRPGCPSRRSSRGAWPGRNSKLASTWA